PDPSVSFHEFAVTPNYDFASPVHRWNQMYHRWLDELPEDRTVIVRQEDQLRDQVRVLEGVEKKLGLHRQGDALEGIERKVDVNATLRGPMNRDYYIDR